MATRLQHRKPVKPETKPTTGADFSPYTVLHEVRLMNSMDHYRIRFTNIKLDNEKPQYFIQIFESKDTEAFKELTMNYYSDDATHETAISRLLLALKDPKYKRK